MTALAERDLREGIIEQRRRHDWRRRVAHAFSRAAPRYRERAGAQQAMGDTLWAKLPAHATHILDLGCGPGHWTAKLSHRYATTALGVDLAPGMLVEARREHGERAHWLCADATSLPLAPCSRDLIFSNLALQWCPDLVDAMSELHRILTPDGMALINTLGPGTLTEVRQAWSRPGRPAGVLEFPSPAALRRIAYQAGFRGIVIEVTPRRFYYPDLSAVMASIKGVGAQAATGNRLSRRDVARATRRYETLREPDGLPVSYQCVTLTLSKERID
ncbi:malonyl-[acyl-carrier protein] O-methyltransferase [Litchfieldella qijiaojingensis]|uniref:Malonyl-[acyl-carrier protein] O-methyltransferase n=1 Tax=Litchfieldella qijiaojingensis TaxID=980347 RepID=A0ABQ2YPH7_9GAMM|nr:malonyl-ACP O-methyltransferase BioC [Halomonas qijiaojingensis]GGX90953.1 malonyl-[acyl-carrier protein] O-methyltransferase [Halomonas qijiaojingensis]